MEPMMSDAASEIFEGLQEALLDAQGSIVEGLKKSVVYRIEPQAVRKRLAMSQQEFSRAFGIPLATLQNWEQGRHGGTKLSRHGFFLLSSPKRSSRKRRPIG